MSWLEILKDEMQKITQKEALEYYPPLQDCTLPYFDFRFEHVKHVQKNAIKLFDIYGGDLDIILAAVWVHDRTKFEPGNHAKTAASWAVTNLYQTGFPENKINDVVYAVSVHSGWVISNLDTIEAKILWDADKLAHFGPAYFFDSIFLNTSKKLCEEGKSLISFHEAISMDNFLVGFSDWKNDFNNEQADKMFYFDESKRLCLKYHQTSRLFYEVLEEQLT